MRACSRTALLAVVAAALGCDVDVAAAQTKSPLVGSWQQTAWKLCKPVAQLTATDVDPPIDDLVFRLDGTFGVMWRVGSAHTGDIPHMFVPVPDYDGHYSIDAAAHRIHMRVDNGLFVPRDFSGDGTYSISGDQLVLTGIWFGTKQAASKPDICELTFTRKQTP